MRISVAFAAAFLTLSACARRESAGPPLKPADQRKPAPEFQLKDPRGNLISLSEYKGKVVLLNFWATWCQPCRIENPWFLDFEQRFKSRGFAVLAVATLDDPKDVTSYVSEFKINYQVVMDDEIVSQLYGGSERLPTTFVIDRDGRIAAVHVGLISKSDYEDQIVKLLETTPAG